MWKCCGPLFLTLGLLGIFSGILTITLYPKLYAAIMKSQMEVYEGSTSYEMWKDLSIPMYMRIFYFNCTNHRNVIDNHEKPLLKQVGPYVFREHHTKTNVSFSPDHNTVDFFTRKSWEFEPSMSTGSLDDEIYTLNMIALSAAEFTRWPHSYLPDDYPFLRNMMDVTFGITGDELFMKAVIRNITFDGIDSPLLHMGDNGMDLNLPIPFDRFGWFYGRNNSDDYDGRYQMWTGHDDIYKVGQVTEWNDLTNLTDFFPGNDGCEKLSGSAGEFFPQDRDKTSLSYFTPDLCRPIHFNFKEETKVSGIHGYKYWLDDMFIGNATYNSSNSCYNPYPDLVPQSLDRDGNPINPEAEMLEQVRMPLINGLLNVSACKFDSPSYVSYPHFYMADPLLIDQFHSDSDLNPNEADHASHISIMPKVGIPLDVKIRLQINILLRPLEYIKILENVTDTFYPMIWFETYTELTDDLIGQMRFLEIVPYMGDIMGYTFIGIGGLLLLFYTALMIRSKMQS